MSLGVINDYARKLMEVARLVNINAEIAAEANEIYVDSTLSVEEYEIMFLTEALNRANKVLDKKKSDVFADVLDITTRGQAERAIKAFDMENLMARGLSLEATAELAQNLIIVCEGFKVSPTKDWKDIVAMRVSPLINKKIVFNRKKPNL